MKRIYLAVLSVLLFGQCAYSQLLYNLPICYGATPARRPVPQAVVELVSTDKGLLLPRVTDTSAVTAGGKSGLMIFSTSDYKLYMYNGNRWVSPCYCNGPGSDGPLMKGGGTGDGIGIGTDNPDPRAIMDVTATDRGVLITRVQDTSAIVQGGVAGLLIYSTSDNRYYIHNGTAWMQMATCGSGVLSGLPANANAGGITGNMVDPSAMLELRSPNLGFLLPRVKDTSAITPGGMWGLLIYSTSDNRLYLHNGRSWMQLCASVPGPTTISGFSNCPGTSSGTVTQGLNTGNASIRLDYTGGNGSAYAGLTVASTGVRGLTATLLSGMLNNGSGSLTFTITGMPLSSGTATFPVTIGGATCNMTIQVASGPLVTGFPNCPGTSLGQFTPNVPGVGVISLSYTGGNGGSYPDLKVTSVGVFGLTAVLPAGTLNIGSGVLNFLVTGTPLSAGTATFPFSFGGATCNMTIQVGIGSITGLNCSGAVPLLFTQGAKGTTTMTVPYSGGNGGSYQSMDVPSQQVGGLTAHLDAGSFQTGSGSLTFTISGVPTGSGTAIFPITIGGQSCNLMVGVSTILGWTCPGTINGPQLTVNGTTNFSISYSGSGSGTIPAQTLYTGNGLTVAVQQSTLSRTGGTLNFTISGVPTTSGTLSIPITLGGQSCNLQVMVLPARGVVTSWTCPGVITGFQQTVVYSTNITIPYSASGGGTVTSQSLYNGNGLTVVLLAGTLSPTGGNLTIAIAGQPTTSGTLSIPISYGGQSCVLQVVVAAKPGIITGWTCPGTITGPQLTVNGSTNFSISYSGSTGGTIPTQTLYTGNGLTVTVSQATLSTTGGTLTFTISGTPTTSGTLSIPISLGGQSCTLQVTVGTAAVPPVITNTWLIGNSGSWGYNAYYTSPSVYWGETLTVNFPYSDPKFDVNISKTSKYSWYKLGVYSPAYTGPKSTIKVSEGIGLNYISYKTTQADAQYFMYCIVTPISATGVQGVPYTVKCQAAQYNRGYLYIEPHK